MRNNDKTRRAIKWLRDNAVMVTFLLLTIFCIQASGLRLNYVLYELSSRFTRNAFIILALIIPIVAGMGINFAITIGAMAAQIGMLLALNFKAPGMWGLIMAAAITVPLGGLFGYFIGALLNKMKGQEMIGSMILGFFANGAYQLLFLFIFGKVIPLSNPDVTIVGATGIANTLNLSGEYGFKQALDNVWKLKFGPALYFMCGFIVLVFVLNYIYKRARHAEISMKPMVIATIVSAICCAPFLMYEYMPGLAESAPAVYAVIKEIVQIFSMVQIPMATYVVIALLCVFNSAILKTRLGQKFRAVGQNRVVANAAGINVNRVRIIAIMISTIFAGWGQIIFVQNLGTLQTYAAHEQVGLYAGAAILVGGASIAKATNGQAILGCLLFHALFAVAPKTGANIFGDPAIGEYFRVFVCYGVIALALVLHTLRSQKSNDLRTNGAKA